MNSRILMVVPALLLVVLGVLAYVLLGIWTWKDAKSRGLNALLWTVVVLLAPSFIGLIIYLAAGRNQAAGLCPHCSRAIQANVAFCPHCGGAVGGEASPIKPLAKPVRWPMVAFLCCIALVILGAFTVGMLGVLRFNGNFVPNSHISIGSVERNVNHNWHLSFYKMDGNKTNNQLEYDGETPKEVRVKSSLGSGKMTLEFTQGSTRSALDLSGPNTVSTMDLSEFEPGRITMTLITEDAIDGEVDVDWD